MPDMKKVTVKKPSGTSKRRLSWVDDVVVVDVEEENGRCGLEEGVVTTTKCDDDAKFDDRGGAGTKACVVVIRIKATRVVQ